MSANQSRPLIDWEAIEREHRAGQLSLGEIGRQHGISKQAIMKRAKRDGWTRSLAEKIREAVTDRVVTDGVTGVTARETVELAAERGVQIVREHRKLIGRAHALVGRLFGEIETATAEGISLKDKASAFGNLTSSLKTLVGLERQAFNLGDGSSGDDGRHDVTVIELVDG